MSKKPELRPAARVIAEESLHQVEAWRPLTDVDRRMKALHPAA